MNERYSSLDRNSKLLWNLRDLGHVMRHVSEGKGSQKRILMLLAEKESVTQRELTEQMGIQPGSASEVIGKLEAMGLLQRTPSEKDRRTMDVSLTESGKKAAQEAVVQREARHSMMFECLSEEEKETLLSLLEKLNCDWESKFTAEVFAPPHPHHGKGHGHHHHRHHGPHEEE